MNKNYYLRNVVTLELDGNKCNGCGFCIDACPHAVFTQADRKVMVSDREACMECGACALNCPTKALTVEAGVGCAGAVVNSLLGRTSECSCSNAPVPGAKEGASCC